MKKPLALLLAAALALPVHAAALDLPLSPPFRTLPDSYEGKTVILYTANINGDLEIYPQIAHIKKDLEAQGADVILVDTGNYLRGSAAANATMGEAVYALMDAAGYDVAAMGWAEFSYTDATTGYPYHGNVTRYYTQAMLQDGCEETVYNVNRDGTQTALLPAKAPAKFQTVCSNVLPHEAYSFQNYVDVTTKSGFTVRFLGVADPAAAEQVQDGYVTVTEPAAMLDDYADATVILSNDPALAQAGQNAYPTLAFDPGVGFLGGAMVLDNATGEVSFPQLSWGEFDSEVARLAQEWQAKAPEVLFTNGFLLNGSDRTSRNQETNLGDLTTDALRWYAWYYIDGFDHSLPLVAIQNGGNCDGFLYPGDVTEVDLLKALPFSPMGLGVLQLTGAQLLETLEAASQSPDCPGFPQVSGLSYGLKLFQDYDGGAAYGKYFVCDSVNRVSITDVNGSPFDPQGLYNVVCDNFLMNGNDTYYTLKNARDAGAKYVNNGPGVKVRDAVTLFLQQCAEGQSGQPFGDYRVPARYAASQGRVTLQRFSDVPVGHWGCAAVNWAVDRGITQGTGAGEFSPDRTCTDAEILTFLWRSVGSPEPAGTVGDTYYYTKSTAWAAGEGITENQGDPGLPCTRSTAVTYLWRLAGSPEAEGGNAFADVPAGSGYAQAVAWAVEQGIATGTGEGAFSPDKVCTRAEIAALLCRAARKGLLG